MVLDLHDTRAPRGQARLGKVNSHKEREKTRKIERFTADIRGRRLGFVLLVPSYGLGYLAILIILRSARSTFLGRREFGVETELWIVVD